MRRNENRKSVHAQPYLWVATHPPCPSAEDILAYLGQTMPTAQSEWVEAHIDGCAACRRLVGTVVCLRLIHGSPIYVH